MALYFPSDFESPADGFNRELKRVEPASQPVDPIERLKVVNKDSGVYVDTVTGKMETHKPLPAGFVDCKHPSAQDEPKVTRPVPEGKIDLSAEAVEILKIWYRNQLLLINKPQDVIDDWTDWFNAK
jgi:hypothetical protein